MVGYVVFDMFGTQKALDIWKYIIDGFGQTRFIVAADTNVYMFYSFEQSSFYTRQTCMVR
jgi:hypothetical protein